MTNSVGASGVGNHFTKASTPMKKYWSNAFQSGQRRMLKRPKWLLALMTHGYPRFATIGQYAAHRINQPVSV